MTVDERMPERDASKTDPLDDFETRQLTFNGKTKRVFVAGKGPAVIVMSEMPGIYPLVARFARWVRDDGFTVWMPDLFGKALSYLGFLPGAPLTRDQWLMLQRDNVPSGELPGLDAFGIRGTPLAAVGYEWLGRFHKGGKFAGRRINLTATN